jgi:hypothetical protein
LCLFAAESAEAFAKAEATVFHHFKERGLTCLAILAGF